MTVTCPSCATAFPVDPAKVPAGGVHATCSSCGRVFFVHPQGKVRAAGSPSRESEATPAPGTEWRTGSADGLRADVVNGGADVHHSAPAARADDAEPTSGSSGEAKGSGPAAASDERQENGDGRTRDEVDPAADDFREWSNFQDLSFEPDEDDDPEQAAEAAAGGPDAVPSVEVDPEVRAGDDAVTTSADTAAGSESIEMAETSEEDTAATLEIASGLEIEGVDDMVTDEVTVDKVAVDGVVQEDIQRDEVDSDAADSDEVAAHGVVADAAAPKPALQSTSFGRRDPHERAARLARVLASDMIAYNQEKYARAVEDGTLAADFEEEVEKSWDEYVEQVGKDMAEENNYFQEALNEILAQGEKVF